MSLEISNRNSASNQPQAVLKVQSTNNINDQKKKPAYNVEINASNQQSTTAPLDSSFVFKLQIQSSAVSTVSNQEIELMLNKINELNAQNHLNELADLEVLGNLDNSYANIFQNAQIDISKGIQAGLNEIDLQNLDNRAGIDVQDLINEFDDLKPTFGNIPQSAQHNIMNCWAELLNAVSEFNTTTQKEELQQIINVNKQKLNVNIFKNKLAIDKVAEFAKKNADKRAADKAEAKKRTNHSIFTSIIKIIVHVAIEAVLEVATGGAASVFLLGAEMAAAAAAAARAAKVAMALIKFASAVTTGIALQATFQGVQAIKQKNLLKNDDLDGYMKSLTQQPPLLMKIMMDAAAVYSAFSSGGSGFLSGFAKTNAVLNIVGDTTEVVSRGASTFGNEELAKKIDKHNYASGGVFGIAQKGIDLGIDHLKISDNAKFYLHLTNQITMAAMGIGIQLYTAYTYSKTLNSDAPVKLGKVKQTVDWMSLQASGMNLMSMDRQITDQLAVNNDKKATSQIEMDNLIKTANLKMADDLSAAELDMLQKMLNTIMALFSESPSNKDSQDQQILNASR